MSTTNSRRVYNTFTECEDAGIPTTEEGTPLKNARIFMVYHDASLVCYTWQTSSDQAVLNYAKSENISAMAAEKKGRQSVEAIKNSLSIEELEALLAARKGAQPTTSEEDYGTEDGQEEQDETTTNGEFHTVEPAPEQEENEEPVKNAMSAKEKKKLARAAAKAKKEAEALVS